MSTLIDNFSAVYPSLQFMKNRYPHVTVGDIFIDEDSNETVGFMQIGNKLLNVVEFYGSNLSDLETRVLATYHWEQNKGRIPCPFKLPTVVKTVPVEVQLEVTEEKVHGMKGRVAVINDQLADRRMVPADEVAEWIAKGYEAGRRNFKDWVSQADIDRVAAAKAPVKAEFSRKGHHMKGRTWVRDHATKSLKSIDKSELAHYLSNGFYASSPRGK